MKKIKSIITFVMLAIPMLSFSQSVSVNYNAAAHTLSVNAANAPISNVLKALSEKGLNVFIVDLDKEFQVNANVPSLPVEEALAKFIPNRYHYFYRITDNMISAIEKQKAVKVSGTEKQKPGKPETGGSIKQLEDASKLLTTAVKSNLNPAGGNSDEFVKPVKNVGKQPMQASNAIQANTSVSNNEPKPQRGKGKHLVATFKVTENGMELVSASMEDGDYIPHTENTASGDHVIIGKKGATIAFVEPLGSIFEKHAVCDPKNNSQRGAFPVKEQLVTIRMPKSFKEDYKSLKLELALLSFDATPNILSKQKLVQTDLDKNSKIIHTSSFDLSKISIKE